MAAPVVRALALLAGVDALAILRPTCYGISFAFLMCAMLVAKYIFCAWRLPVLSPHAGLLTYATLFVGLNSVAAVLRTCRGTTVPLRYTGHSPLWKLLSTRTLMLRVEPLLAVCMAFIILAGMGGGYGLVPLEWPYTPLQPMITASPMSPAWRAFLGTWGAWIAIAQALALPLGVWAHNRMEYNALPGAIEPSHPVTASTPALTFQPVYAAAVPRLPVPSAARLAAAYAAQRVAPPQP